MSGPQLLVESTKKATSSVQDVTEEKPVFGSRFLTNENDVWTQNAWDHVPPPEDQVEEIAKSLSKQRLNPVSLEDKQKINEKPAKHWDNFYKMNASNFFRDRKWLHNEFPELVSATRANAGNMVITEVGCGAGNSVFPLLSSNHNTELNIYAYDYSSHAIKLVQHDPLYISPPVGTIHASVWDVTSQDGLPPDIAPGTVDIVIMVFVMSALHPDEWGQAINNIQKMLKPGGLVLFRDYGRYDLTQLRFKGGRLLDDNFYIRGDKTRVYFFELDELSLLFTGVKMSETQFEATSRTTPISRGEGEDEDNKNTINPCRPELDAKTQPNSPLLSPPVHINQLPAAEKDKLTTAPSSAAPLKIHSQLESSLANCANQPLFSAEKLGIDRRLIVNRKRQLKMYRVWMQAKFRKL